MTALRVWLGLLAAVLSVSTASAADVWIAKVVKIYPHDPHAFTEGLFYKDGWLYESTGLEGASGIRKVRLETGEVVQALEIPAQYFGEGIIDWGQRLIELTWKNGVGFVYDLKTFKKVGTFSYPGEGWALTKDARHIFMSDGTPDIRVLDPGSLNEVARIHVADDQGRPVQNLNELEYVKGEIFANIWRTNIIARIDPKTGRIVGWIDLTGLLPAEDRAQGQPDVLNGIAYDAKGDRLFVTGKLWPKIFEIKLARRAQSAAAP